jgi:hypothetical protein
MFVHEPKRGKHLLAVRLLPFDPRAAQTCVATRQTNIGATVERKCSMNFRTSGLKVRPLSVKIATGHGRVGNCTGKTFNEKRRA